MMIGILWRMDGMERAFKRWPHHFAAARIMRARKCQWVLLRTPGSRELSHGHIRALRWTVVGNDRGHPDDHTCRNSHTGMWPYCVFRQVGCPEGQPRSVRSKPRNATDV